MSRRSKERERYAKPESGQFTAGLGYPYTVTDILTGQVAFTCYDRGVAESWRQAHNDGWPQQYNSMSRMMTAMIIAHLNMGGRVDGWSIKPTPEGSGANVMRGDGELIAALDSIKQAIWLVRQATKLEYERNPDGD
jgi:hypothetical protein